MSEPTAVNPHDTRLIQLRSQLGYGRKHEAELRDFITRVEASPLRFKKCDDPSGGGYGCYGRGWTGTLAGYGAPSPATCSACNGMGLVEIPEGAPRG